MFVTGLTKAYSVNCQTSKMKRFSKIVSGFQPLIIFRERSVLDAWQNSKYASYRYNKG